MENTSSARTMSVAEAAALTGLSKIALQRRIDRGTIRAVVRDGRRRVPVSELRRAGLIDDAGAPLHRTGAGPSTASTVSTPPGAVTVDTPAVALLIEKVEQQAGQLAEHRLLTAQAESLASTERTAREAAEAALHEVRAELTAATARIADLEQRRPPTVAVVHGAATAPVEAAQAAAPARRSIWPWRRPKSATRPDVAGTARIPGMPGGGS